MIESEWVSMIQAMKDKGALSSFALKLYGAFGPTVFGRSVIPLCYAETVFDAILAGKNYDTILDIGTGNGIPAVYMAQYCKHVRTIDIVDNPMRKEVIKLFGMEDKIKFSKINSECEKEIRIETIAGGFDFCYMDGAHSETTYSDWMMVRQCGRVLFHEYYTDQKPVYDLVNSFPLTEVTKFVRHDNIYPKDTVLSQVPCVDFAYWEKL